MSLILKQSTSIDIRMGPFVDATDAVTPETGITLAAADQAEVLKANGAATVAMAGTFAAVTGADGWYDYTVATGDVDTVGEVVFVVQDSSVCLPVFTRGYVVEEAIYDALYGAASAGFDANGRVDIGSVLGTAQTAGDLMGSLGEENAAAAAGDPSTTESVMQYVKQLVNVLVGTAGVTTFPAAAAPANNVSLAEILRAIYDDTKIYEKNVAANDIPFLMVDATDGRTPETGLTVTAQRSLDGAAFAAATGTVAEIGNGMYVIDASAADMNGDAVLFRFSATGAADTFAFFRTK